MKITRDDIIEAGRRIESCLEDLEVSFTETGFIVQEKGADRIFGKRVDAGLDEHGDAGEFASVGFYGESGKRNDYSPAVVSIIPESRWELGSFLRFAIGAAFNKELEISFLD